LLQVYDARTSWWMMRVVVTHGEGTIKSTWKRS
jgi:hypothetical protein